MTGAAGGIGRALIPQLCSRPDVSHVIGIDQMLVSYESPKFSMHRADMRDASLAASMNGADVVVHLAFALTPGVMTVEQMRSNNVQGSINVLRAARTNRVRKVINLSSVSVYGSGEELDESAPLAPSPRFPYACQKAELERIVSAEFADIETVHLRSTFILGPHATPFLKKVCNSRVFIVPRRPFPKIQVVHEDDVSTAIVNALNPKVRSGAFNIAAPEAVTVPELIKNRRSLVLGIPIKLVERIVGARPDASEHARSIDTGLELLRVTLTVSCERARQILGWQPRYSAWQARAS